MSVSVGLWHRAQCPCCPLSVLVPRFYFHLPSNFVLFLFSLPPSRLLRLLSLSWQHGFIESFLSREGEKKGSPLGFRCSGRCARTDFRQIQTNLHTYVQKARWFVFNAIQAQVLSGQLHLFGGYQGWILALISSRFLFHSLSHSIF